MCNSCCVSDAYNSLIEDLKDIITNAHLKGAGCFMGSCCASRSQTELVGRAKALAFEFHPAENEPGDTFFYEATRICVVCTNPCSIVRKTYRYGISTQGLC